MYMSSSAFKYSNLFAKLANILSSYQRLWLKHESFYWKSDTFLSIKVSYITQKLDWPEQDSPFHSQVRCIEANSLKSKHQQCVQHNWRSEVIYCLNGGTKHAHPS